MGKLFNIAFRGEIADGFSVDDVRSNFAERFRKDENIIARLFSGSSFTLAKGLEFDRANAAATSLRSIGAIVYLVDDSGEYFEVEVDVDGTAAHGRGGDPRCPGRRCGGADRLTYPGPTNRAGRPVVGISSVVEHIP